MLGLLEDKLYAHQAIQDSVKVTDAEVKGMMEAIELLHGHQSDGQSNKVLQENNTEEFRSYFFDILKEKSSEMQKKLKK
jgi:peptidyl-prolyl cis-trans isomerase SurA